MTFTKSEKWLVAVILLGTFITAFFCTTYVCDQIAWAVGFYNEGIQADKDLNNGLN